MIESRIIIDGHLVIHKSGWKKGRLIS